VKRKNALISLSWFLSPLPLAVSLPTDDGREISHYFENQASGSAVERHCSTAGRCRRYLRFFIPNFDWFSSLTRANWAFTYFFSHRLIGDDLPFVTTCVRMFHACDASPLVRVLQLCAGAAPDNFDCRCHGGAWSLTGGALRNMHASLILVCKCPRPVANVTSDIVLG